MAVALFFLGVAPAQAYTIGAVSPQTLSGESFTFDFSGLAPANGEDGTLTLHARGDYGLTNDTEFLSWKFADSGLWTDAGPSLGGTTIIQDNGPNDVEWTQSFQIAGAVLASLTADGILSILVDLNLDDDFLGVHCCYSGQEFVAVSLTYAVPEPSGALLFAAGAACLAWRPGRRRP